MPHRDSIIKGYAINSVSELRSVETHIMPYPPSLSKIAARTRTDAEAPNFGHLMQRVDSLEKTLMLGRTGGRRRKG